MKKEEIINNIHNFTECLEYYVKQMTSNIESKFNGVYRSKIEYPAFSTESKNLEESPSISARHNMAKILRGIIIDEIERYTAISIDNQEMTNSHELSLDEKIIQNQFGLTITNRKDGNGYFLNAEALEKGFKNYILKLFILKLQQNNPINSGELTEKADNKDLYETKQNTSSFQGLIKQPTSSQSHGLGK